MQIGVKKTGSLLLCSLVVFSGCYLAEPPEKTESTAPKDAYGLPYLIGDLGGKPVNLPSTKVDLVEYDDSPGWDAEKIKNYNPPPRTYASVIESFGFEMRYTDGLLREPHHKAPQYSEQQYQAQRDLPDSTWIRVGVSAGKNYNQYGVNASFNGVMKKTTRLPPPQYQYQNVPDSLYGLELYAPPGINQQTGIAWRNHPDAQDMYVYKNSNGEVSTIIECRNRKVKRQTCAQRFNIDSSMKVSIRVRFMRNHLADWQKIQREATKAVESFVVPLSH